MKRKQIFYFVASAFCSGKKENQFFTINAFTKKEAVQLLKNIFTEQGVLVGYKEVSEKQFLSLTNI